MAPGFPGALFQNLVVFIMVLPEYTVHFLLLSLQTPAVGNLSSWRVSGFATSPTLQYLGKPGDEKQDFASFYKAGFTLSVNQ